MEKVLHLVLLSMVPVLGQVPVPDVGNVSVISRTETELTLEWSIVENNTDYSYVLKSSSTEKETNISAPLTGTDVRHNVSSLSAGTYYSFTLYTVLNENRSSGYIFSAVTAPSNVDDITVIDQTDTEIKLQWDIVNGNKNYSYVLKNSSGAESEISAPENSAKVTYEVRLLSPATKYSFTLYTVYETVRSSGYNFSSATTPPNVDDITVIDQTETEIKLQWDIVNGNKNYSYVLKNSNGAESEISALENSAKVTYEVLSLSPGTKYSFTLYTVYETVRSSGYNFSSATIPSNVADVFVVNRNDSYLILQWMIVTNGDDSTYDYSLEYRNESVVETITINSDGNSLVERNISGLIPATNYSFTLYTIFDDLRSKGFNFTNSTTLSEVTQVRVTNRSQTYLAIEWDKLNKNNIYNYTLSQSDGKEMEHFSGNNNDDVITYNLSNLSPGTEYKFTLFTVVKDTKSAGYNFKNVTTIDCALFDWQVTNSSIKAEVNGSTDVTARNSTGGEVKGTFEQNLVNLTELDPGAKYTVLLWYDLESQKHLQCSKNLTLDPNSVSSLHCKHISGGYGLAVVWDTSGIVDKVQVDVAGKSFNQSESKLEVKGLQVAKWYNVSATSFSDDRMGPTVSVNCQTDPAGVIAGVLVSLLLIIIIFAGIFLWRRKLKHAGGSKRHDEPKKTNSTYKPIPMERFPEHFRNMSRDQNRGFSEEYEDLGVVGVEQSKTTAEMHENKSKNRFTNVLPYECSRVHLLINNEDDSDYINANYMPGYGNASRQYIATQGPLPSTVNDFWRMIWERRSQGIVMVTNCLERGIVKCEQYWPLDYTPCLYGYLLVTIKSEDKAQCWTLREFAVKNKNTSETRTVRHFHFTAWPDHGVPLGTGELIRFRGLIRQHIESTPSSGPTVVHCSAGVGRTGTLIALDVLIQQLEREKAVSIAGFVQRMRLNRPLMVQTESQYVFLHQCIMDILQSKDIPQPEESIYENSDIIFANAVALKEYEKANQI